VFIVAANGLTGPEIWKHAERVFPTITARTRNIVRPDFEDR
jgi:hypothetical protein